jgi:hypothetical protein
MERRMIEIAGTESFTSASTLAFLESLPWSTLRGRVVTDESGVWTPYFAGLDTLVLRGGPRSGFGDFGQPLRQEMTTAWHALHACSTESAGQLRMLHVRYVFLGPLPNHYTLANYVFEPGNQLEGCPGFSLLRSSPAHGDYFYEVK